jgi:hypothetical protein
MDNCGHVSDIDANDEVASENGEFSGDEAVVDVLQPIFNIQYSWPFKE